MNRLLMEVGPGAYRQAACLIGGYWDAQCALDIEIGHMVRESDSLYYELGLAAACLEGLGIEVWREVVRRHVATRSSTPTMRGAVEDWERK